MKDTHIFLDKDFCENSIYRSWRAEEKLADWSAWAEANLPKEDLREIERAIWNI